MKVRIYKAPDGKGKLVKAKDGMAVNTDKEIKKKIAEGKDPEIIIYEMAEFGLSRDQARDKVYKLYDLLGDDDYDEEEPTAPYDQPVEDEVAEVVEEEEPDNAAIYDYYGGDNQGLAVVNDGADDEDEDDDMARYGGQYAEGGQFAPGSIVPKPKEPYYIGMDAEPYDNAYKFGGLTKGAYVKKRIKELRKAAQGEEVKNNETNISPRGTIDSPAGFTSPEKNLASIIKQTGNEAVMKQQAENEYQQYQDSTMGEDFNGKFLFGGRNRKIRRANRAMFGTPTAIPGVDVNYEFGPLGGLRKAEANWDLDAIGDLAKLLPGAMNMMPGMFPGMMPGMMSYKKVSYPAQVRKKTISTINNAALDEVANQNPNSTAAQNNRSDKKNEIKCPPGAVYDSSLGHCVDQEGNRVRSIIDLPDPEELLGNPFENPNARMLNGKKTMKATGPAASASSNASAMITQAPSRGGAPLQSQQGIDYEAWKYAGAKNPYVTRIDAEFNNAFGKNIKQSGAKDNPNTSSEEDKVWSSPVDQDKYNELMHLYHTIGEQALTPEQLNLIEQDSYITTDDQGNEYSSRNTYNPNPEFNELLKAKNAMIDTYGPADWDWLSKNKKLWKKEHGGFVDAANMDPNTLAKFIYGGDEYAYGGDVLHKAYDGYITNFQKQMDATKKRIDQMGNKKPEDLLGNPFKGNPFGKATTGIQPSGTVGNRFQPSGQPNTGTTTQGGTGTSGGGRGIMSAERSAELAKEEQDRLAKMTPAEREAEMKRRSEVLQQNIDRGMLNPNMTQYGQMMQGQQGNPFMGNAFGNQQFSVGRPQRLGFGLTRDFNYSSGFFPVNWQVPEGTKSIRKELSKDRKKWWNPFDTVVTEKWYADTGEIPDSDKSKSEMQDKAGTATDTKTGTTDPVTTGGDDVKPKVPINEQLGVDRETWENMPWQDQTDMINAGEDQTKAPTRGASQIPTSVSGQAPETIQSQGEAAVSSSNPFAGNAFSGNQFGSASTGVQPSGNLKSAQSPNDFTMSGQSDVSSNPFSGNAFGTASTGISGNVGSRPAAPSPSYPSPGEDNPMADPKFVPTPQDYNPGVPPPSSGSNPAYTGEDGLDELPMAYGGYMNYGGYVPEYMAYGGYMPMAKPGIVVDKAEFSDPNLIGRTVEQSAYTFNPGQFATDLFSGPTSLTGLLTNTKNAISEERNILNPQRIRNRTSDAATANTGQSGFGSAERKGSDLMASGNETQYGSTPGKQGYEGGLYGKKGGSMNTQYAKGKVYSLTMDQIKAIEAAGGKVEYIK